MRERLAAIALLLASCIVAPDAGAQRISSLEPGTRVRINAGCTGESRSRAERGRLLARFPLPPSLQDTLHYQAESGMRRVGGGGLQSLDVSRGHGRVKRGALGAALGLVSVGVVTSLVMQAGVKDDGYHSVTDDRELAGAIGFVLGGTVGFLAGAGVGAATARERWQPVVAPACG